MDINIFLFEGFETLDAAGPVEVLGNKAVDYRLKFYSKDGGAVHSLQGLPIETQPLSEADKAGILFIPGAVNVIGVLEDERVIKQLRELADSAPYCLTVCTGAVILAKTGALDGKRATTNKMAFEWVTTLGFDVKWVYEARWVRDGKFFTSSGVSAGIDMALGFVSEIHGRGAALAIAEEAEYNWSEDPKVDPFASKENLKSYK